jgi:Fe2+ transport system protein B
LNLLNKWSQNTEIALIGNPNVVSVFQPINGFESNWGNYPVTADKKTGISN